ncbi:RDD family protein [Aquimarina pacifica]|uniref:RDD family protein n=1 Tax=Aquimarina pacifica TaxID=1296415 RepID=UPI00046F7A68|nr:RDD family protein [Aquimarina pacifica]
MDNNKIKRLVATIIDLHVYVLIIGVYALFMNGLDIYNENGVSIDPRVGFGVFYGYYILSEFFFKTTLGKKVFKIKVNYGKKNLKGFIKVVLRNFLNLFELLIPFLYLIPVLIWNKKTGELISKTDLAYE